MSPSRKLTLTQQRVLDEVSRGRIRRTHTGWLVGETTADAPTRATLRTLIDRALVTADHGWPLEPGETITAELTDAGTQAIHRGQIAQGPRQTEGGPQQ